jgi:integrase
MARRGRRPAGSPPEYLHHRASGRAYCTVRGKTVYLGRWHSPESWAAYEEQLAAWRQAQAPGPAPHASPASSVLAVAAAFLAHAKRAYLFPDGRPTSTVAGYRIAVADLTAQCGGLPAAAFGSAQLRALRALWVGRGHAATTVQKRVGQVRHLFRWAHGEGLVPATVLASLDVLPPGPGEGGSESDDVPPVAWGHVEPVLPLLRPPLAAVVRLQWWCGCRPGEACAVRGRELNREGTARVGKRTLSLGAGIWCWQPQWHKNRRKKKDLVYALGPNAQAVLVPFLTDDPDAYLFTTRTGRRYSVDVYRHRIHAACERLGIPPWNPGQIRHSYLGRVDAAHGLRDASLSVGHASPDTTLLYLEHDLQRAAEIAREMG